MGNVCVGQVANGKFQFSYLQAGTVNHKVLFFRMKLKRSEPFRLYLIDNNNWWGNGTMIGN